MFNSGEAGIFQRLGMSPVFFGETIVGRNQPSLTYMLSFENLAAREQLFSKFGADPEWKKLRATPGLLDSEIVSNISNAILRPAVKFTDPVGTMKRRSFLEAAAALPVATAFPAAVAAPSKKPVLMKVGTQHSTDEDTLNACSAFGVVNICSDDPPHLRSEVVGRRTDRVAREGGQARHQARSRAAADELEAISPKPRIPRSCWGRVRSAIARSTTFAR